MPTLKDIQEQKIREIVYRNWKLGDEVSLYTEIMEQVSLAFQAGEKSKEDKICQSFIRYKRSRSVSIMGGLFLKCKMCSPKCGYNQALSSLKEKIISDSK